MAALVSMFKSGGNAVLYHWVQPILPSLYLIFPIRVPVSALFERKLLLMLAGEGSGINEEKLDLTGVIYTVQKHQEVK